MHPNALLEAATELVHRVLRFEHPADRVVADFFRDIAGARLARAAHAGRTVYAVLRERRCCGTWRRSGSGEMERRLVLLGWQGNAGYLRAR